MLDFRKLNSLVSQKHAAEAISSVFFLLEAA
jgi:hypothetical protein